MKRRWRQIRAIREIIIKVKTKKPGNDLKLWKIGNISGAQLARETWTPACARNISDIKEILQSVGGMYPYMYIGALDIMKNPLFLEKTKSSVLEPKKLSKFKNTL